MRLRALRITAVVLLAIGLALPAVGQDLFYDAYERGRAAFDAGNLALARQMFERAMTLDSRQSRQKRFSGMTFRPYFPEFYLGRISYRERQYEQAIQYFDRLEQAGLIKAGDPEHATLTAERQAAAKARTTLAATATTQAAVPPPAAAPPTTAPPSATAPAASAPPREPSPPSQPGVPAGNQPVPSIAEPVTTTARRDPPQVATEAPRSTTAPVGPPSTAPPRANPPATERPGADADRSIEARPPQTTANDRQALARAERGAFADLLRGEYRKVVEGTAPLVDAGRGTPRLLFYAACGRAAQSLTAPADARAALVADARRLFQRARTNGASFSRDEAYISPAILAVLRQP